MLGWAVPYPRGSSRIEPGVTPVQDLMLSFPTWTAFETDGGQTRLWGGGHFQAEIDASRPLCSAIGNGAFEYVLAVAEVGRLNRETISAAQADRAPPGLGAYGIGRPRAPRK